MNDEQPPGGDRWAHLRFAIVGPLLAAPPRRGQLKPALGVLAAQVWRHPITTEAVGFCFSTIERWYYAARNEERDPVGVLRDQPRRDRGHYRAISPKQRDLLGAQYHLHQSWSYQLHTDNLATLVDGDASLGVMPSYNTVRRYMAKHGLVPQPKPQPAATAGEARACRRRQQLEIRSYEAEYVHGRWHLDFHQGSLRVLTTKGEWLAPHLLGVLDDCSRLNCHLPWYLHESTETLVHGFSQATQKRGLPRSLLSDNGSAMIAAEFREGLRRLGIVHETTLPHSPYQNAKQEAFWTQVENRLLAMLEGVKDLTLEQLNEATQAWVEMEYQRHRHSELGCSPLERYLKGPDVGRPSPGSDDLRRAFRASACRIQRKSDGTISLAARRFEVPSRYRSLTKLDLRYARWDLRMVDLVDPHTQSILCTLYPLDKTANADGQRRRLEPPPPAELSPPTTDSSTGAVAPLLRKLMADYAATGLPPAYLPKTDPDPEVPQP